MRFVLDKITRLALRFRALTIGAVFVLMALGVIAWTQLNQELLPPIEIPQTIILTQTSGMSSEQVLTIVTQPIEDRLSQMDEIINLQSETQSSFGSFITAFNDFGQNQSALQGTIREALRDVWLPSRTLEPDDPAALIATLTPDVLLFMAESDSNFLFQLTPEIWEALDAATIEIVLAYMAQQQDEATTGANALQRLVDKEIVPQLSAIDNVANVDVSGGETLPTDADEAAPQTVSDEAAGRLILRLSPDIWAIVSARVDGLDELDESAIERLSAVDVVIPAPLDVPELPENWRIADDGTPTLFNDANDLLEIVGFGLTPAGVLNNLLRDGVVRGSLGLTSHLTLDTVERMLDLDPTMAAYFDSDHILALPEDVFAYLTSREEVVALFDGFTRDAIAARIMATNIAGADAEAVAPLPVPLPDAWRIQPPQLITFSFSDIPLATFSVASTGDLTLAEALIDAPAETTDEAEAISDDDATETITVEDAPLPAIFGQLSDLLGVPLVNTSDLLALEVPEEGRFLFDAETISAAEFLNILADPPDLTQIPEDQLPEGFADVPPGLLDQFAPLLLSNLSAESIAYLAANEPDFAATLAPETIALLSASASAVLGADAPAVADSDAPALNPEWRDLAELLATFTGSPVTLATADDLLNPALPIGFILPELFAIPNSAGLLEGLFANLPPDVVAYIADTAPNFFATLPAPVLVFLTAEAVDALPESVRDAVPAARAPEAWDALLAQTLTEPRTFFTTDDIFALSDDGRVSTVLNRIASAEVGELLDSYTVRLIDSLRPDMVNIFLDAEPDFFDALEPAVLLSMSSETLNMLTADEIDGLAAIDDAQAERLLEIRADADESAFAQLAALYASDVPPPDPAAPDLNPGWQNLGNFYNIELNSADDFFRFPPDFPFDDGAQLIDSLFDNPQGESSAPVWLGGFPRSAAEYIQGRDAEFFNRLSNRALALLPEETVAVLPEEAQERARARADVFQPASQITRTNGNDSLFITVFKDADANTVSTYAAVFNLLSTIDVENENIEIGVVFEQSSFIEESIEGVAREGSLGAVFAVIIILIFLSGGTWNLRGRRMAGSIMTALFLAALLVLVALNVGDAGGDWGLAFDRVDVVLRVLLVFGVIAGFLVMFWPGNVPDPSWRATLVIAVSIPLSIMTALVGMYWVAPTMNALLTPLGEGGGFFGFLLNLFPSDLTLNIMTLSGLTVAVGRVVDDSIVVLENIFRQLQVTSTLADASKEEKQRIKKDAIIQGTRDVSAAIFAASLIAASVFLPLGLTGGIIGAFFLPFGLAVTYALIGSFVVAITVIPVLAYLFIDIEDTPEDQDLWLAKYYRPTLEFALRNRWTKSGVILLAIASIGVAGFLFAQRPFAFLPNFGEPQVSIEVSLPGGTSVLRTNELVVALEEWIVETYPAEDITAIQTIVGGGGAGFEALLTGNAVSENRAAITVGLAVPERELADITREVELEAKRIFNTCPTSSAPANSSEQRALMEVGIVDSAPDIVCADGSPISNNVTVQAAAIADGGFGGFDLVVSGPLTSELNAEIIERINEIDGLSRASSNFIEAADDVSVATFIRVNRVEAFSYSAELNTENTIGVTQEAIEAIRSLPEIAPNLCASGDNGGDCFTVSEGFESEVQTEGFQSIGLAMVLAIGLVIVILSATMQSFVYWLAIVFSIMVAPIGAAIALTLTDRVLGISAMIGLLMLIGLVIANGVVLIDRVRSNRRERGMPLYDALVEAGGRRLRPILMTSLATIIALTPLAIGLSEGAIIASELGTVVIGGVFSSTFLTLIVVPVVFSVLSPIHRLLSFRKDAETRDAS